MNGPARVLVDATNLRTGGAVQVASAVLTDFYDLAANEEACRRWPFLADMSYAVSAEVADNLAPEVLRTLGAAVRSRTWRDAMRRRPAAPHDVSFVVFGPDYSRPHARRRLMGCADGLVLLPWPKGLRRPKWRSRLKYAVKKRLWLAQAQNVELVVEADHLRRRLIGLGVKPQRVHVVSNSPHPVFLSVPATPDVRLRGHHGLLLCYPARAHDHKNHEFLVRLHEELKRRHGRDVRFVVTLTSAELAKLPAAASSALVNLGPLTVDQVPAVFAACDGAVFPSLLETFSATPVEALASGVPLFAADRAFVRDVVGDVAGYFDPLDPAAAAQAFVAWWDDAEARKASVCEGRNIVAGLPDSKQRAVAYLDLLGKLCHEG